MKSSQEQGAVSEKEISVEKERTCSHNRHTVIMVELQGPDRLNSTRLSARHEEVFKHQV